MPFCPQCGHSVLESARFCVSCGAANNSAIDAQATLDRSPSQPVAMPPSSASASRNPISVVMLRAESGRIVPGTLLADRYRIVALIGRGGMGEVYRAEDLKLDEDVALKLLPEKLVQDGAALARFHREVRIARDISHPNVCRVFDIGEANGVPFISMEYIDGEDLATLLRKIGRLPQDKAIEISRQLCAGIAAAHEHGVLHRDLKPSNIMLDGRGKVRIMDFGLAGVAADIQTSEISSGTPAYMAPEQLAGKEVTIQSDIYALGLVLYEVFTGKRAFEAATLAEMLRLREHSSPSRPSSVVHDLDPLVERVMLRCLEADPQKRPKTALEVSAALPGGDPLAAALAAGETPSPQMVAAAGGEQALAPRRAWALLASAALALLAVLWVAQYATDLALFPIDKTPDGFTDRAREIVTEAGYKYRPADSSGFFERNYSYLLYREEKQMGPPKGQPIAGANPGAIAFVYRQSPEPLAPKNPQGIVTGGDPPYDSSGMTTVKFDSVGRLLLFIAVPDQRASASPATEPNWRTLFDAAGLDLDHFTPAPSKWLPAEPFDVQRDWEGNYEGDTTPIHVTAASYSGKPVYFQVIAPWNHSPMWMHPAALNRTGAIRLATVTFGGVVLMMLGVLFARKNIRLGRGDRKGAFRIALFYFCVSAVSRVLVEHHTASIGVELSLLSVSLGLTLLGAALLWIYYMALEPYVRRRWPEFLISWSRLVNGKFRDPMVGRDLLAGALFGTLVALCLEIVNALPAWFNLAGQTPINNEGAVIGTAGQFIGALLFGVTSGMISGLTVLFLFFLVRSAVRHYWIAILITGILLTLTRLGNENVVAETVTAVIVAAITLTALLRFGLLAVAAAYMIEFVFIGFPIALDPSRWYFARGIVPVLLCAAIALYGFRTSFGNRPVFAALTPEE